MLRIARYISLFLCAAVFFGQHTAMASHYRAGEITYRCISGRTYEISAITYTDPQSNANANTGSLTIVFGDNSAATVNRTLLEPINKYIQKNTYTTTHTYQTDGSFLVSTMDQNRVDGIKNISGGYSKDVAFYVESLLRIVGNFGFNQSPVLKLDPIDDGCGGFVYVHNPSAFDPDGDSLTYELIPPKQGQGLNVPDYTTPDGGPITINRYTGDLVWNTPPIPPRTDIPFIYNIAIQIKEWRGNQVIGYVVRDMQIRISNCPNSPPVIGAMQDYCVEAGQTVSFIVTATDPNPFQRVTLTGYGSPFDPKYTTSIASLVQFPPDSSTVSGRFTWKTTCNEIKYQAFPVSIRATDDFSLVRLSDVKQSHIQVIGPAPRSPKITQVGNGFKLTWIRDTCRMVSYYKIYKHIDSSHWVPPTCFRGVPVPPFSFLDTVRATFKSNDTTYFDDNNGEGLSPFITYCYRVVGVYAPRGPGGNIIYGKESDSRASEEVCGVIIRSKPVITHVSIRNTSSLQGSLHLRWLRPDTLDTVHYVAPYRLVFKRSTNLKGPYTGFDSTTYSSFSAIRDSALIDTFLNTAANQYFYKIDFYSIDTGFIDASPVASSVRAAVYATDRKNILSWNFKVPWVNDSFVVYRKNISDGLDSIGVTAGNSFSDTGLWNGREYCYVIKTLGSYSSTLLSSRLENLSQIICGTPVDTIPPCPPLLTLTPPCNTFTDFRNVLTWLPQRECSGDVVAYKVYNKRLKTDNYKLIDSIPAKDSIAGGNYLYRHSDPSLKNSIAGCYVVTGVDSFGNESYFINEACTDNCPEYRIPNVFTPNGDGYNDMLIPFPYRFVDGIDLIIFNRWGTNVFATKDLDINWDGKDKGTGAECADGVYFYICDVYELFLEGVKKRTIRGTIHIIK